MILKVKQFIIIRIFENGKLDNSEELYLDFYYITKQKLDRTMNFKSDQKKYFLIFGKLKNNI